MKKISHLVLLSATILLPLLVLPLGELFAAESKQFLGLLIALIVLVLVGIKLLITKNISIVLSPFTAILGAFGGIIIASIFLTNSYPVNNLLGFGGVYLALIVIAGLGKELVKKDFAKKMMGTLGISAAFLSLLSLLQLIGYGPSRVFNFLFKTNVAHTPLFSLMESPAVVAQFLGVVFIGYISLLIMGRKKSKKTPFSLWIITSIILVGLGINVYSSLPNNKFTLVVPSLSASWSVALEMLRTPRTALLGAGPNNYHLAYTQFKPSWVNQTTWWNVQFTRGSNLPLTLLVSTGILGFGAWLWLITQIYKQIKNNPKLKESPLTWILIGLILIQLLFPPFTSLLILFGLILAGWLSLPDHEFNQAPLGTIVARIYKKNITKSSPHYHLTAQILGVVFILIFAFGTYGLGRATMASHVFFKANRAGQNNQVLEMYQFLQQATNLNPFMADYRRRYALTNLSLATALANKANLTTEEQANVMELIQQSIREGRAAAQLQSSDVRNWQILAQIYSNLTGVIDGADQWAVNSYIQAIQTSPTNPELRVALGSIFYSLSEFEQAEQLFTQAIQLKPNHANAHYNLANSLVQQNKFSQAVTAYENVLILIEPTNADYELVSQELTLVKQALSEQDEAEITEETEATSSALPSLIEENLGLEKEKL